MAKRSKIYHGLLTITLWISFVLFSGRAVHFSPGFSREIRTELVVFKQEFSSNRGLVYKKLLAPAWVEKVYAAFLPLYQNTHLNTCLRQIQVNLKQLYTQFLSYKNTLRLIRMKIPQSSDEICPASHLAQVLSLRPPSRPYNQFKYN